MGIGNERDLRYELQGSLLDWSPTEKTHYAVASWSSEKPIGKYHIWVTTSKLLLGEKKSWSSQSGKFMLGE